MIRFAPRFWMAVLAGLFCVPHSAADFMEGYNDGIYFYKKGEYELAAKAFEEVIGRFPGESHLDAALFWCGQSYERLDHYPPALACYKKIVDQFPKSTFRIDALYAAGTTASHMESYRDALPYFSSVLSEPGVEAKLALNSRIKMVECHLKLGDDVEAERMLRELLSNPQLPRDRRLESELRLRQILSRTGRSAESRTLFSAASKNSDLYQVEDYMYRGDQAYAAGRYGESRTWYDRISGKAGIPAEFRARAVYNSAQASLALGESDRARALFTDVLSDKDAQPDVRGGSALRLAYLHRSMGKHAEAERLAAVGEKIADWSGQARLKDDLLFFRAEYAFGQKNYGSALTTLSRMTEGGYRVDRLAGLSHLESGRHSDAAESLERALVGAPDDDSRNGCFFELARNSFRAKQYDQALTNLSRIRNPSSALQTQLQPLRADVLYQLGQYKDAAAAYERLAAETSDPSAAKKYRYLGVVASFKDKNPTWAEQLLKDLSAFGGADGEIDDPAAFLEAAMQIDREIEFARPGREPVLQGQLEPLLARQPVPSLYAFAIERLYSKQFYKLIPKFSQAAMRLMGSDPAAPYRGKIGWHEVVAYQKTGRPADAQSALEELMKWTAENPKTDIAEDAEFLRGELALETGDRSLAREAYWSYLKQFAQGKHVKEAYYRIGELSLESGRAKDAEEAFSKLIGGKSQAEILSDPNLIEAAYQLAMIRLRQNRPAEAAAQLEPLSELDAYKDDPAFHHQLAMAYLALGKISEAVPHLRSVSDNPKTPADILDRSIDALFSALYRTRQTSALESDYRRLSGRIKDKNIHSSAKYYIGLLNYQAGRYPEAISYLDGVQDPPGSDRVLEAAVRAADCEYHLGRYQPALDRYSRVIKKYPETPRAEEAFYAMELSKIKLGLSKDPLAAYERFLKDNPNAPQAPAVAYEAAKFYFKGEDMDAAERMLDLYEKRTTGAQLEDLIRLRIDISKRRGRHEQTVQLAQSYLESFGKDVDVAIDAAIAATKISNPLDPFGVTSRRDAAGVAKVFEDGFASAGKKIQTLVMDEKFYGSSRDVDVENTLLCVLKRIQSTESRVFLIVEATAVSFMVDVSSVRFNTISFAGTDLNKIPGVFLTGIQLGHEFPLRHTQSRIFVISIPKDSWTTEPVISLDIDFARRKLPLTGRVKVKLD